MSLCRGLHKWWSSGSHRGCQGTVDMVEEMVHTLAIVARSAQVRGQVGSHVPFGRAVTVVWQ